MKRCHSRRRSCIRQLESKGYRYEIVDGAEGASETPPPNIGGWSSYLRRSLLEGEIGCYQSHLKTWNRFLGTDDPWCLVVEDDVELHCSRGEFLEVLSRVPGDFDYVRGDIRGDVQERHPEWVRFEMMGVGTYCYVIARSFAQFLVEHQSVMEDPVDIMLRRWSGSRNFYAPTSPVGTHGEWASSTISDTPRDRP